MRCGAQFHGHVSAELAHVESTAGRFAEQGGVVGPRQIRGVAQVVQVIINGLVADEQTHFPGLFGQKDPLYQIFFTRGFRDQVCFGKHPACRRLGNLDHYPTRHNLIDAFVLLIRVAADQWIDTAFFQVDPLTVAFGGHVVEHSTRWTSDRKKRAQRSCCERMRDRSVSRISPDFHETTTGFAPCPEPRGCPNSRSTAAR